MKSRRFSPGYDVPPRWGGGCGIFRVVYKAKYSTLGEKFTSKNLINVKNIDA